MIDLNTVALTGGLPRDCEFKVTQNGLSFVTFTLGFSTYQKGVNERNEKSNYIDVSLFGKQAENLKQYLIKGVKIAVSGKLNFDSWNDQNGQKRTRISLIADSISLLSRPQQQQSQQNQNYQQAPQQQQYQGGYNQNQNYQQSQQDFDYMADFPDNPLF